MKTRYFKSSVLLAIMVAGTLSLGAQALKEEQQKDFAATSSTELSIDNQFGNITITDWDQSKVTVSYIVEVTNSDEAKAKKIMDKIKVEVKEEGNKIIFKTIIGELGNLTNSNSKGEKQSFRIDYFVKCPKNIKISLDNQFGDVIVSTLTGPFNADLQFGSLNAVSLTGPETKIDMQFGQITIGTLKDAKFDIQHSEALKISDCGNITIDAQFAKLDIGNLASLKGDISNSEITIETLKDMLKIESNMGNVKIGTVSAGFTSLIAEVNMGDFNIGIDPNAGYKLEAEVNMGSIKVPDGLKKTTEKESDMPGITVEKISGTYGNGNSMIKIDCNMGSVKIK